MQSIRQELLFLRIPGDIKKSGHPLFLLSVLLLIANDWLFKSQYGNAVTGKLSDFAGLFAFPFLFSVLFPRWKKQIHVATVLAFIFWKSDMSEPLIYFINGFGIPVHRIVDVTDLMALVSVPAAYYVSLLNYRLVERKSLLLIILAVSSISFVATTLPRPDYRHYTGINKAYQFNIPLRTLVSRLNAVQLKEIRNFTRFSGGYIDFDAERNVFHYQNRTDTLALILDYTKIKPGDTIVYKSSYAKLIIAGDDQQSTLKLISIYYPTTRPREKDFREKAIRIFEKRVVKKIRKMPDSF